MKVTISTKELLYSVRKIAESETTASFAEADERYRYAPGTEKDDIVFRSLKDSDAELRIGIARFIRERYSYEKKSIDGKSESTFPDEFVFDIIDNTRRIGGKQDAITYLITTFLVEETLCNYYARVSAKTLSDAHGTTAATVLSNIVSSLYQKRTPRI